MSEPTGLRPSVTAGVRLPELAAQVGAVLASGVAVPDVAVPDVAVPDVAIPDVAVTGVTLRAQDARPGDLFAALPGSATHGGRYAGDAIDRGAVAVLTDAAGVAELSDLVTAVPVLMHPDTRGVLGGLAAAVYGHPSEKMTVVGITGTSGKTTTAYMVESALRAAGRTTGLIGTIGVRIDGVDIPSALTTPEAPALQAMLAAMAERGVDTVVMEVSSHALALGRVDGTVFAVAGFTNLSRDHLDFHSSMEAYFDAKALLFDPGSPLRARHAVVCVDDDAGRAMADRFGDAITVRTTDQPARPGQWSAVDVAPREPGGQGAPARGSEFTAVDPAGGRHRVGIGLVGRYNVANALLALAVVDAIGVSPERAAPGLLQTQVPGRMEDVDVGQDFLALVDYAHKPGALRAVLTALARPGRRLAVVFGAGGQRDPGKRRPMGEVAAELADLVVVTDDNPRNEEPAEIRREIVAGASAGAAEVVEIADRREAIRYAVAWAGPGDVVLIAGKGHETGQAAGGTTRLFDDRVELAEALTDRDGARR